MPTTMRLVPNGRVTGGILLDDVWEKEDGDDDDDEDDDDDDDEEANKSKVIASFV